MWDAAIWVPGLALVRKLLGSVIFLVPEAGRLLMQKSVTASCFCIPKKT